ncbi:MAG TPA: metallophosphoesterase [Candidatus Baltobacteraceae bacterium]
MSAAQPSCESFELAPGVVALTPGLGWLPQSRVLIAADVHLGYEDVVGGALPLWSTVEALATLTLVARRAGASEIVFLGDAIHASRMSEGAAISIARGIDALRAEATLTFIAGNHEGRSRGYAILGQTVEEIERDGWFLVHGDRPSHLGFPTIIGHLHPSLRLRGGATVPAFIATPRFVVLPALTPYSSGLDVLSQDTASALGAWAVRMQDAHIVAGYKDRLYPFGSLANLRDIVHEPDGMARRSKYRRRSLRPDR